MLTKITRKSRKNVTNIEVKTKEKRWKIIENDTTENVSATGRWKIWESKHSDLVKCGKKIKKSGTFKMKENTG